MGFAAILSLIAALPLAAADPSWAGAETCAKCHPAQYQGQSQSGHAHALRHSTAAEPGDWAFGSGTQAITFVSRVDAETYREHGETWYRAGNSFGFTPGHRNAAGVLFRLFDPDARILRCFGCHSTGPLSLSDTAGVVPRELGVRCESCHGPGAAHATNPAASHMQNPMRLPAAALNTFCGKCHRLELGSEAENKDVRDPRNSRNQPLLLAASACFRGSKGRLTCFTCHAPHTALEQQPAAYDRACAGCHASPRHTQPVAGRACAVCHMPAVRYGSELAFGNHRIGIYAAGNAMIPVTSRKP